MIAIIKKFIFDFLKIIDEYRKEKRRRDFSDSEDDDDPFHNKSSGFGFSGCARNRLNATPTSIRADSIAGRSRASGKGAPGPVNIQAGAGGKNAQQPAGGAEQEFTEFVGDVPEFHARLKELWTKRTQLMKVKKKKKKKARGRSALKK
mmetsp:Transcript_33748/g.44525  ORF Transcript_33748/g.44525 Transcript_33748/m.44525 type:complete len:148 (-) Transcript_33748:1356-1799(-)|eukprot:CAMPEP_0170452930 /NCGR_PEP_ID=MMETSP0123-20130129/1681_1 /TAXON_ID=182087 /ORGANISM="Favella ehrenbergii, Strain Fehren 1" /LENGTH=147 /DNA_ID=CAMNT_0010715133 /DNA_START=802 /DNA_END=1245 /DNA_ORIENTATION=+